MIESHNFDCKLERQEVLHTGNIEIAIIEEHTRLADDMLDNFAEHHSWCPNYKSVFDLYNFLLSF